jgi:hypothetical protein
MLSGAGAPDDVRDGLDHGVFYYLAKPWDDRVLASVVASALRESAMRQHMMHDVARCRESFALLDTARFHYRTPDEAEGLACLLANAFPSPDRVVSGLVELMMNAIEHGNLAIGYEEKTQLLAEHRWRETITERLAQTEHASKQVELVLQRQAQGVFVQITDQGEGFDWKPYLTLDYSRGSKSHGRGIAHARMVSFDQVIFNKSGNRVTAMVHFEKPWKPMPLARLAAW